MESPRGRQLNCKDKNKIKQGKSQGNADVANPKLKTQQMDEYSVSHIMGSFNVFRKRSVFCFVFFFNFGLSYLGGGSVNCPILQIFAAPVIFAK